MTDRPIIFSSSMILAIIRECDNPGTGKTQTRRIIKAEVPPSPGDSVNANNTVRHAAPYLDAYNRTSRWCWWTRDDRCCLPQFDVGYAVGDRIWVRETWAEDEQFGGVLYRADHVGDEPIGNGWRPSIFMPRAKSRITLTVTAVRVQGLQEISPNDVRAEGIQIPTHHVGELHDPHRWKHDHFRPLWASISGETGPKSWTANPWIVAVSFIPELRNIDAAAKAEKVLA